MSGKVRMTVALEADAAARLDELTTEPKRGEYLSKLVLAGDPEGDAGKDFGEGIAEAAAILQGLLARLDVSSPNRLDVSSPNRLDVQPNRVRG